MKRYLKYQLVQLLALYNALLGRTSGKVFVKLFNLKSFLRRSPARVAWNGEEYIMRDRTLSDWKYVFKHERQGGMAYERGFAHRATTLGKAYFLSQIDFGDGDVVLDCGANVGDLKLWFDFHNLAVEYIGFEPSPVEYSCLKKNVAPAQVHNLGLWKHAGELVFFVSSQRADSSLIEPSHYDEKITVQTKPLEGFIKGPVKLLKLEAEGAEPEILEGLGDQLSSISFITADLGYERGTQEESTLVPVVNFLLSRGFELVDVGHDRICALFRNKNYRP